MRKIYSILSVFFFSLFATSVNAQVGTYVFVPSAGTYSSLTGTTTSTATGDDGTQNVALGFNFIFGGVSYSNTVLSTNGAMKLAADGTTTFGSSWVNAMSNTYGAPIIGGIWDDNNASGGSVVYVTSGTAPNRTFSAEWINVHMGGGGSTGTGTATFSITLAETSNIITIRYGTVAAMTSSSAAIGLNDLLSFLSVTPGSPATASSVTANNNISSSTNLTSGTTYTFFPPPPCSPGSLGGGNTQSTVTAACASSSFLLTVTGASFGTGLTYQWESSPDGATWTPINTATSSTYTATQSTATYYRRKMSCSGTDAYSVPIQITQNGFLNCYCNTGLTGNINGIDIVTNVVVTNASGTTLTQASTSNGTTNYDQYNNPPLDLAQSTSSSIAISFGNDGSQHSAVWIDYNQNGVFEASENIALSTTEPVQTVQLLIILLFLLPLRWVLHVCV